MVTMLGVKDKRHCAIHVFQKMTEDRFSENIYCKLSQLQPVGLILVDGINQLK